MLPMYVREKACALGSGANSAKEAAVVVVLSGEVVRKELVVGEEVALLVVGIVAGDVIVGWTVELDLAVLVVIATVLG